MTGAGPEIAAAPLPMARTFRRRFVVTPQAILRRKRGLLRRRLQLWWSGAGSVATIGAGPRFNVSGYNATLEELARITFDPEVLVAVEAIPAAPPVMPPRSEPRAPVGTAELNWVLRSRPAKVYEVFPFDMELDLLEIRLHELHDLVDKFVIVESPISYGCVRKPLLLERNWDRFRAFHHKMIRIEIDDAAVARLCPGGRRGVTSWEAENWLRERMWQRVRALGFESDAVIISSDADEMLPRNAVFMLKHHLCPLPMRIVLTTLRFHFRWLDAETPAAITAFSPAAFLNDRMSPAISPEAPRFHVRGAAHFTAFLPPVALIAKIARTTDWERGVEELIRNERGEVARMMHEGRWLNSWALAPYDADQDPLGLVPGFARANRARYGRIWGGPQ